MPVDKRGMSLGARQYHLAVGPGDVSECVLLPGDPGRVLKIAEFLEGARKVAENREFLTYRGTYRGVDVTATSTGIGCPSAAIAIEELANVGARVFIRVGTSGAIDPEVSVGDLVIPVGAIRNEGTSYYYVPEGFPAVPDFGLVRALVEAAEERGYRYHVGVISTDDAFYAETPDYLEDLRKLGVKSLDMESSTLFVVAHLRGLRAATVLGVVANLTTGDGVFAVEDPRRAEAVRRAIEVALEALARVKEGGGAGGI